MYPLEVESVQASEGTPAQYTLESGDIDFGGHDEDVDAVDGLLLVLSPWAVRNLRFDADRFDHFHGYDVDFCFQARAAGRRVVVDDIELLHHTNGGYNDVADFFKQVMEEDSRRAAKCHEFLRQLADEEDTGKS